jgi:endoglucanase
MANFNSIFSQSPRVLLCAFGFFSLTGCASAEASLGGTTAVGDATGSGEGPNTVTKSALEVAPTPPKASGNPFSGASWWVNPNSQAATVAKTLASRSKEQAVIIERIAAQPSAVWLGEWSGAVKNFVSGVMQSTAGKMPVFVLYNLPYRDCGNYSKGGLNDPESYRKWVRDIQSGAGTAQVAYILEPDALGLLDKCLNETQKAERLSLLRDAVMVLRKNANAAVYLDAGHAHWVPAPTMAERLAHAGIEYAHGFALNTSNYGTTEANTSYGEEVSKLTNGAHFVIDTSRNGNGPTATFEWCNPKGRHVGHVPTVNTGHPLVDAWLWIKPPGESDGECNGGPKAGEFWIEQALELGK